MMTRKSRIRWLISGALVVGFIGSFASIYLLVEHTSGEAMWAKTKAALAAGGLSLDVDDLVQAPSDEALRHGEALEEVLEKLRAVGRVHPRMRSGLRLIHVCEAGRAMPAAWEPQPILDEENPPADWSWTDFESEYAHGSDLVMQAHRILAQGPAFAHNPRSLRNRDHLGGVQELLAWLRTGVVLDIRRGDHTAAVTKLSDAVVASELMGSSETLIGSVLRMGCWSFAVFGNLWEILQEPSLNDRQLEELSQLASRLDFSAGVLLAMKVELAASPFIFSAEARSNMFWSSLPGPSQLAPVRRVCWPFAWKDAELARVGNYWAWVIPIAEDLAACRNWSRIEPRFPTTEPFVSDYDLWRFPISSATVAYRTSRSVLLGLVKVETRKEMARAAIALRRYQLATGRFPESLEELVPGFLPALPIDWFDGQPLRYRKESDGEFVLYSISENGVDDGGAAQLTEEKRGWGSSKDLVWPRRVSPRALP